MKPRTLTREEEAELARSNKKVKDIHHVEFNEGPKESSSSPGFQNSESFDKASFKEKLVGEIPGAYVKAFAFDSIMEEDDDSDGEGHGEPFFKPSTANVSLIAVWIRLYELPIKLYEAEVLKELEESIGKVLRIDSHTAIEARSRYAKLCIQIDINQPLVNTILIGLGHKVVACPYTICKGKEQVASDEEVLPNRDEPPHEAHVAQSSKAMAEVGETMEVDDQYGPWMVVGRRTNGRKGTKSFVSTESTNRSTRNATPQLPPKNSEWRGTSSNGPAFAQTMPRKDSLHGARDYSRRTELVWTPIVTGLGSTDIRDNSKLGPLGIVC
ncbi:uncharacterized protein LOC112029807 [Quercus suber]|uniref:uncharacterized protein LOC112029807 n=1 Tax=Quercus suber TaxID=58331 RepID=UPI000CE25830|nr:uncharacterized protein LOC112029807 [Quercus suber]